MKPKIPKYKRVVWKYEDGDYDKMRTILSQTDCIDRHSLEKIYLSFIRPLLEYSSIVWDNCTAGDKQRLENIQIEAARIVTGATKLCKLENLYRDTGWDSLQTRRDQQKLIMLYKMIHGLVPSYLTNILPARVGDTIKLPIA